MTLPTGTYCGQCGRPWATGEPSVGRAPATAGLPDAVELTDHASCLRRAELEPPRYCPHCARRMVVQVNPMGWRAVCSQHGELRG